ncbi:MAG: PstA family ABC transporter permease [Bacilli bacterium]|jgi:phosphate transport system permease protein
MMNVDREKFLKKRKLVDRIRNVLTYISAFFGVLVLAAILAFIFIGGLPNLSFKMLVSDYKIELTTVRIESDRKFENPDDKYEYFSSNFGVAIEDGKDNSGERIIVIEYLDENSPFKNSICIDNTDLKDSVVDIEVGSSLNLMMGEDEFGVFVMASNGDDLEDYIEALDRLTKIDSLQIESQGGGIRGSLLTTIILIITTLIIALPIGIGAAIYIVLYAKESKFKRAIVSMIDMTSGVPSIIFGFVGAIIFIPFVTKLGASSGYTILAGALTMSIVLLPVITKTTAESLLVIPLSYQMASLSLGASKTQTVFKVILPNAFPGILQATLLSIGRIIGESAALLFVMGSNISDEVSLFGQSTSLSLHIWNITSGESPNFGQAAAISIIILIVVFVMSTSVKLISKRQLKNNGG